MKRDSLLREKKRRSIAIKDFLERPTPDFIKNMPAIIINEDSLKNTNQIGGCYEKDRS